MTLDKRNEREKEQLQKLLKILKDYTFSKDFKLAVLEEIAYETQDSELELECCILIHKLEEVV